MNGGEGEGRVGGGREIDEGSWGWMSSSYM